MRTDYLVRLLVALGLQQMNLEVQVLWAVNVSPGPGLGHWHLSERVRHDSVSTVAFKFQAHHLFHIFKFDVSRVRTRNDLSSDSERLDKFSEVLVEF